MKYFLAILLIIALAGLWFFGRVQPVVVIEKACPVCQGQGTAQCSKCGGTGSVEIAPICAVCNGTGKGEWKFKSPAPIKKSFKESRPICTNCGGTGTKSVRRPCAQCQGKGKIACPKCKETGQPPKTTTVRAGLSPLEKILSGLGIAPAANCRPQRKPDGSYPIILKYIETYAKSADGMRVVKWDSARLVGNEWLVRAVVETRDPGGQPVRQGREFIIENREIKGSRKTDWNG